MLGRLVGVAVLFGMLALGIFGVAIGTAGDDSISRSGSIVAVVALAVGAAVTLRVVSRELLVPRALAVALIAVGLWVFWFEAADLTFVRVEGGRNSRWWVYRDGDGLERTFGDEAPKINHAGFSLFWAVLVVLPLGSLAIAVRKLRPSSDG